MIETLDHSLIIHAGLKKKISLQKNSKIFKLLFLCARMLLQFYFMTLKGNSTIFIVFLLHIDYPTSKGILLEFLAKFKKCNFGNVLIKAPVKAQKLTRPQSSS